MITLVMRIGFLYGVCILCWNLDMEWDIMEWNGVGSLTGNRGRLSEKAARERLRALPFRVEKRGDSRIMKQNMAK
jgi:hypothetical protein